MRVLYAAQTSVAPPTFVLFTNVATKLHFSYERFLENRLRETYGFFGTPIRIQVRGRRTRGEGAHGSERAPERGPVKKGPGAKRPASASRRKSRHQAQHQARQAGEARAKHRAK